MSVSVENLWDELSKPLLRYIKTKVKSPNDAEDILQTVFVKIYTELANVNDPGKIRQWIYCVTRNAVVDHYRAHKPHVELRDDQVLIEPDAPDEALNREVGRCLRIMIDSLPDKDRQALLLTEVEGLSQKKLSEAVGITLPGAKSRVQRARRRLKKLFLECCEVQIDRYGNVVEYGRKEQNYCSPKR